MPTYDYVCKACGAALEIFQSMKERPKKKCPRCGELGLERRIGTGAGIIFKGSGFYQTDYRSDSYRKGAEAEKKSSEGGEKKETAKDTAKEAKKEPKKGSSKKGE